VTHEDLRTVQEKLAEKFYRIYGRQVVDMRPWSSIGNEARQPYFLLAAEALRQRLWAMYECHHEWVQGTGYQKSGARQATESLNLGIAPEGWEP
jgi:hypothetical protein